MPTPEQIELGRKILECDDEMIKYILFYDVKPNLTLTELEIELKKIRKTLDAIKEMR